MDVQKQSVRWNFFNQGGIMNRKRNWMSFIISILLLFGFSLILQSAEAKKAKIFVSADIEGVGHAVGKESLTPGQYDFERARRFMTAEVNAAIEGCLEAGAGAIVVTDGHGNCLNLIPEELNEAAELVRERRSLWT